jgi:Heparinase II/III-like protein/Heparinase II/III N-terminus
MIQKIVQYAHKIITFGPRRSSQVVLSRIKNKLVIYYWRSRALQGKSSHSWEYIKRKNNLHDFEIFFESQKLRSLFFVCTIYAENKTKKELLEDADFILQNNFKIFENLHSLDQLNWHADVTLDQSILQSESNFNSTIFYKDIQITPCTNAIVQKDIKVPWELSRFQHLFVLGKAYQLTKNKKYYDCFMQQVTSWLDNNSYLLGVNWICPMEVGLRAINWIIAFSFFKDVNVDEKFWQRFTCSLYDHFMYLENNWEIYDSRTSNHYLSDLVGYLYLCWFFKNVEGIEKKLRWVQQEIVKEMEKQVFNDGTDYEGSTRYHQLVTELFYHAYLMFQECGLNIPQHFADTLKHMFAFIQWCTPKEGSLITIGDNDSGKVLYYGLPLILRYTEPSSALRMSGEEDVFNNKKKYFDKNHITSSARPECFCECKNVSKDHSECRVAVYRGKDKEGTKHFPQFGLSIIKNKKWHISLRHHAYHNYQPSGHFHNDIGSITLAINGIPVFVDPGSYVYTPSAYWRNKFRSVQVHNTCYIDGIEPVPLNNELFYMPLPEHKAESSLCVKHNLYKQFGLSFERKLVFKNDTLMITDLWRGQVKELLMSAWNFTLGPDIIPKKENGMWLLQYDQQTLITLSSDLDFEVQDTWISPEYGTKVPSLCLRAKKDLYINQPTHIYLKHI